MRMSQFFLPVLKDTPAEAQIVSHRLMLRAGMIRQSSAGIYSWLPLGIRVLKKIEQIVREEQNATGAQELLMPTNIKLFLSVVVLAIGFIVHYWEHQQGNVHLSWMVAALAVFMVLAMWIFPEAGRKNENKGPTK